MAQHGAANVPGHALVRTGDEFPGEDHQIDAAALFDQLATGADGVAEPVWPPSGEGEMRQQQFHTPPLPGRIVGTDTVILPALGFCGTPGCKLRDRHPGLCSSLRLEVRSFRKRTPKVMGDAERWEMPSSGRSSGAAVEGRVASTQPTKLVGAKRGRVDTTTSENVSPASRVEADPSQPLSSPLSIAAKEALRLAKAEGLTLLRSESSNTGFMNVTFGHVSSDGRHCAYSARIRHGGKQVVLGVFDTAEEAALCVARALAAMAASPEPLSPAAEEALQPAQAENLTAAATLVEAKTEEMVPALPEDAVVVKTDAAAPAAFEAVAEEPRSLERELLTPLWLYVDASGSEQGPFAAWQVAAWYQASQLPPTTMIRHVSDRTRQYRPLSTVPQLGGVAPSAGAVAETLPPAQKALRQAEAEGLTLLRSESSSTGYKGVHFNSKSSAIRPYQAKVQRGGKNVSLGTFATAEEAALAYARASTWASTAVQAAPPPPPATSSKKRKVRSEEQPPDVPADVVVILEGRFVESTAFE